MLLVNSNHQLMHHMATLNPSWRNHPNLSWKPKPSQYAPPAPPQYASTSQPSQPRSTSPVEQTILNLSKVVGNFVEEHKAINTQLNQKIDNVESTLNKRMDGFQNDIAQKIDNLAVFHLKAHQSTTSVGKWKISLTNPTESQRSPPDR